MCKNAATPFQAKAKIRPGGWNAATPARRPEAARAANHFEFVLFSATSLNNSRL
jgi:hypothetical protein